MSVPSFLWPGVLSSVCLWDSSPRGCLGPEKAVECSLEHGSHQATKAVFTTSVFSLPRVFQTRWQILLRPQGSTEITSLGLNIRQGMEPRRVGQGVEEMASDPSSGPFWGSSVICHRSCPYSPTMIYITMPTGHNSDLAGKSGIDLGLTLISPPSMDDGPGVGAGTRVMGEVQGGDGSSPLPRTCFGTPRGSGAGVSQSLSRLMTNKSYESPFPGHQPHLG